MLKKFPKLAIIYLSFHSESYWDDVVSAFKKITYPKEQLELVIVDNPHKEFGSSVRYIEENILPLSGKELPHITLLPQNKNLGFAGGNNVGITWALEHNFEYIFLHNNDGFVSANCFEPLVGALEQDKTIGAAQSLIMLYPETDLINTAGNSYQFLGVGYCGNFRQNLTSLKQASISNTGYVSGAAVMLRGDLLKQFGLWDEDFWLYHEDIEYSLRLKAAGFKTVVVRDSVFYHKYNFSRNKEKFYFIERNRLGTLLIFYKLPTLILLLPVGIFWELGMIWFALRSGWLGAKLKSYLYWLWPPHLKLWLGKRRRLQRLRTISDRKLLVSAVGQVKYDDNSVNSPLLKYFANPILATYWWLIRNIIFW